MTTTYDLAIIGGGTAALVASVGAAGVGAKVVLIESDRTGGDCLWTGCVPSKAILAAAKRAQDARTADRFGVHVGEVRVDFAQVMDHVRSTQQTIAPVDSPERLEGEGVEVVAGRGRFTGEHEITVALNDGGERVIRFHNAVIATGSQPMYPPVPGLEESGAITNEGLWELTELPRRMVVLGGGPIGAELGQAFSRLGSDVAIVEMAPRILIKEEPEASALVHAAFVAEGIEVLVDTKAVGARRDTVTDEIVLTVEAAAGGAARELRADVVLVAAGRRPSTAGLGLELVGVDTDRRGAVVVDDTLRTSASGIFAAGDVAGLLPFTHVAGHHGGIVVTNALFKLRRKVESAAVPWVTFTEPEVGHVGLTEADARAEHGDDVVTSTFHHDHLDRALAAGVAHGFTKIVARGNGKIIGATIVGEVGGEATAEVVQVMANGGKWEDLGQRIHAYPTFGEGVAKAANEHLRTKYLSPRTKKLAAPVLKIMRRFSDAD